jgi:hypothetical protein
MAIGYGWPRHTEALPAIAAVDADFIDEKTDRNEEGETHR